MLNPSDGRTTFERALARLSERFLRSRSRPVKGKDSKGRRDFRMLFGGWAEERLQYKPRPAAVPKVQSFSA